MKYLTLFVALSLGLFDLGAEAATIQAQQTNLEVVEKTFEPELTAEEKSMAEETLIQAQQKIHPMTARESGLIAPKAAEDKLIQAQQKNEHKLKKVAKDFFGPKLNRAGKCLIFCSCTTAWCG